jgi:iron complex outermembrane receptor protein
MEMKSALCASVSVAVICLATGTPVMAQNQPAAAADDASVVEEVVVSARKREERLRDVPIAATVLDESAIADQGGLRTIEDLIANAPAVHFLDTSSP